MYSRIYPLLAGSPPPKPTESIQERTMRERGISFKDPLVLAIERGEKTQTRRLVVPMPGPQSRWLSHSMIGACPRAEIARTVPEGVFGVQMEHPKGGPGGWIRSPYGE